MFTDTVELSNILSNASSQERYIILMNNTLLERNQQHVHKIKSLEDTLDDLHECLCKAEARSEDLSCLVKKLENINIKDSTNIEVIRDNLYQYNKKARRHLRYLQTIIIAFVAFFYEFYCFDIFMPIAVMMIVITAFQESTLDGMKRITINEL
jgi:hypothetical protein